MKLSEIPYREFPEMGLFKDEYRNNIYKIEEFKDEFEYYENTPIEKISIDEYHSIPLSLFTVDGINYLIPKIIEGIRSDINEDSSTSSIEEFIIGISSSETINTALSLLKEDELQVLKESLEKILFGNSLRLIEQIGEYYLFRSLEYIEKIQMELS